MLEELRILLAYMCPGQARLPAYIGQGTVVYVPPLPTGYTLPTHVLVNNNVRPLQLHEIEIETCRSLFDQFTGR